jgi:hypothetical protein
MPAKNGLKATLWEQRNTTRLAYVLQIGTRLLTSVLSLIWIRLLVGAMGAPLNSLYLAFQKVISLGGLGDLGMGGVVGIRVGQDIGRGKEKELQTFLAPARGVFLLLAAAVGAGVLLLSPWLPRWLHWPTVAAAGPLTPLFVVGAVLMAGVVVASYWSNLNYACGNVTWPILPAFGLLQLGIMGHWLLARQHLPLWVQVLPYTATMAVGLWLTRFYVRTTNPALAGLRPLHFSWRTTLLLSESSFWVYLCGLGNAVYRSTDALVITAGSRFEPGTLTWYDNNYKFCDIAVFLAGTASFVSLPKITQWMHSADTGDQRRARDEMRRLNRFQTLLGCGAALAYLAGNNLFMHVWWRHKENVVPAAPLALQLAFALNMAITASGDVGIQISQRSGKHGMRVAGTMIALTGLLNLGLSIWGMKLGSLQGIAMATVAAQSVLSLAAGWYTCRHLETRWLPWALGGWLLPVGGILLAFWLRVKLPFDSAQNVLLVVGAYTAMLLAAAWAMGINLEFIRGELVIVRKFFEKK